jgi:hypothetical protein
LGELRRVENWSAEWEAGMGPRVSHPHPSVAWCGPWKFGVVIRVSLCPAARWRRPVLFIQRFSEVDPWLRLVLSSDFMKGVRLRAKPGLVWEPN